MRLARIFFAALALSLTVAGTVGCDSFMREIQNARYKAGIEKALHEDALTGHAYTQDHVNGMRSVDMAECPQDFRVAYMQHIHAWEESVAVQNVKTQLDAQEDAAAAAGVITTLFGQDDTPWSDHVAAENKIGEYHDIASADIKSTWGTVEEIASKYNARIPR